MGNGLKKPDSPSVVVQHLLKAGHTPQDRLSCPVLKALLWQKDTACPNNPEQRISVLFLGKTILTQRDVLGLYRLGEKSHTHVDLSPWSWIGRSVSHAWDHCDCYAQSVTRTSKICWSSLDAKHSFVEVTRMEKIPCLVIQERSHHHPRGSVWCISAAAAEHGNELPRWI